MNHFQVHRSASGRATRLLAGAGSLAAALVLTLGLGLAPGAQASVLRVGTWQGIPGQYSSIQAAVDAAQPGDWILVGPGDYKEQDDHTHGVQWDSPSGVVISTAGVHLRGMDRNGVVVDGTKPGSSQCSNSKANQDYGVPGSDGKPEGRNGILIWKADNVSIENLTACNFLNGTAKSGNEIWWNGGDGGGKIGIHNIYGSYLTATSTFFDPNNPDSAAAYGIFASNASGGVWEQMYSNNMSDSNFYVGACQQVCNQLVDHVRSQYSAQGYSGTNAGGTVVIENSEFDHNRIGFSAGALNNDDWPAPMDGACPNNGTSPITHTYQCWVFIHNSVHDNNNPDVPGVGIAGQVPTGTGLFLYGGRDSAIMDNTFANNGAWGAIVFTYPDPETPPSDVIAAGYDCHGGIGSGQAGLCTFDDWGNAIIGNTFQNNGFFKNKAGPGGDASNADFGEITSTSNVTNCFSGNVEAGGGAATSSPPGLQMLKPTCNRQTVPPDPNGPMAGDLACDSQALGTPCPPNDYYPTATPADVVMPPVPSGQATMPDPCLDVPRNPWCPNNPVNPSAYPGPNPPYLSSTPARTGAAGSCATGRVVVLRLRRLLSRRLRHARVTVNGRRVRVSRKMVARVQLPALASAQVVVRIRGRLGNGRRIHQTRRYGPCPNTAATTPRPQHHRRARRR